MSISGKPLRLNGIALPFGGNTAHFDGTVLLLSDIDWSPSGTALHFREFRLLKSGIKLRRSSKADVLRLSVANPVSRVSSECWED